MSFGKVGGQRKVCDPRDFYPPAPSPFFRLYFSNPGEKRKSVGQIVGEEAGTFLPGAECDFWACALCVCTNVPAWLSQQNRGSLWLACFIERPEVGSPGKACQQVVVFLKWHFPILQGAYKLLSRKKRWKDWGRGGVGQRPWGLAQVLSSWVMQAQAVAGHDFELGVLDRISLTTRMGTASRESAQGLRWSHQSDSALQGVSTHAWGFFLQ